MATATNPVFVGRAEELGRLVTALRRAEGGRPAVALVAGDAGVGKTRLLAELAGRAGQQGTRVLVGGCMEVGDVGLPYVPFIDAFRDLGSQPGEGEVVAAAVSAVPSLGRLLPRSGDERLAAPPPSDDGFERVQFFDGVLSLLVRLSELAPLLLVVEDLHWAGHSTRDLLAFLVRTLRSGRIALVASYRSDELHRRHPLRPLLAELVRVPDVERVELPPFNRAELAQHLEGLAGGPVAAATVDRILARSEGNAFFAEELVAAGATRTDVGLPDALADVLLGRVEAVSELAQAVLRVAAVAGRRVSHGLLVAAAGLPEAEVERALREAIGAQVLVADASTESYRFRHALLQEVVYGDLLPGERIRLHATYARLLAGRAPAGGSAAELAHHCLASHDLPGALAALVRAATEAHEVSAPAEAYRHLTHAIELWDRVPDADGVAGLDRVHLLLRAARAASDSGELRQAVALAREAVAAVDPAADRPLAALAQERLADYVFQADSDAQALIAESRRAVELAPADPPDPLRARAVAGLARHLVAVGRPEEARRWCDEALAVARASGSTVEETRALITLGALEHRHGDVGTARSLLREARGLAEAAGDRSLALRAQCSIGTLEMDYGDLAAARPALDEAVAIAERAGLAWSLYGVQAGVLRTAAHYLAGAWDEAERFASAVDDRSPAASPLSASALYVEVGRGSPSAVERLERLRELWDDDDWLAYITGGCGADLALWHGDLDRARELVGSVLSSLDVTDEPWALSAIWPATLGLAAEADRAALARAAADEAVAAEAERIGRELVEGTRASEREARATGRQVGPEAVAWLARAEAEWARLQGDPDPKRWAASAEAFASFGYVYEEARSRWRLAEALLESGRRDEAQETARAAHATAVRLRAKPLRTELEALARRARLDLGPTAAPTPDAGTLGLTPRELEVLRLVAAGRSNQQIADTLFISRKTASVHVSNILTKLGVRTRVEAAATAHRIGLPEGP